LSFLKKEIVEELWSHLCKFVHGDLRAIALMTVVADILPLTKSTEKDFQEFLKVIKLMVKITVAIFFRIAPSWLRHVEKVYFDAVLEAYTPSERKECREVLRIV
jgi:hypothetical protein